MVAVIASAVADSASTPSASGVVSAASERLMKLSAPPVTAVISGTSVIANAPFMVCTARSRLSVTGCGATLASRSQACNVA